MTPFRWKNCYADVATSGHSRTVQSYLDDIVEPAVRSLEDKIEEFGRSKEGWAPFAQSDMQSLLRETMMAFSLAVQSIWERQLRNYLLGCARELRLGEGTEKQAMKATWSEIGPLFEKLRGIAIEDFPSYALLDALHLLGNACRHGDGVSAAKLWGQWPDLWPHLNFPMLDEEQKDSGPPPVALMVVPLARLRELGAAIISFWEDAEYIYLESLERKHPSVVTKLEGLRKTRSWLPQAASSTSTGSETAP